MIKKAYKKPDMEVFEADMEQQILAGSLTGIQSKGLDNEESFDYGDGDKKSGDAWNDAW